MSYSQSLKAELKKLQLEVEQLKEARAPRITVTEEIIELSWEEAQALPKSVGSGPITILQNVIVRPPPRTMDEDEPLPPDFKVIHDETKERRRKDQADFEAKTKEPRKIRLIRAYDPNRLEYPKGVGGW